MSKGNETKASILDYVENFIDKRDNELRAATSDDEEQAPPIRGVDRDTIVIKTSADDFQRDEVVSIYFLFLRCLLCIDFFLFRIIVHQHPLILILVNLILKQIH